MLAAVMAVAVCNVANAQFKFGPRIGLEVNKLHFNDKIFEGDNRAGFTGGVEAEFMIPAVGLGLDASLMYVRRDAKFMADNNITSKSRDYFAIPVNLKYKIGIPVVAKIVKPYIYTGPEFAFLTSGTAINQAYRSKKYDVSWNVGLGFEFIGHLQVGAGYGIGLSKAARLVDANKNATPIDGKNRYWTVTAAWLF